MAVTSVLAAGMELALDCRVAISSEVDQIQYGTNWSKAGESVDGAGLVLVPIESERFRRGWWLWFCLGIAMASAGLASILSWKAANDRRHLDVLTQIQIGSDLASLLMLSESYDFWGGKVVAWYRPVALNPEQSEGEAVMTPYGKFYRRSLGDYVTWAPSAADLDSFSGVVTLYLTRSFSDSVCIYVTFLNGKVVDRDWGYMPG